MSIALYMDAHVPRAITIGLRLLHVDVLTAQEDGAAAKQETPAKAEPSKKEGRKQAAVAE